MNKQVKAKLSAVKDFFAGRPGESSEEIDANAGREEINSELLAVMAELPALQDDTSNLPAGSSETEEMYQANDSDNETRELQPDDDKSAPQVLLDESYFEDTVESLRPGRSSAERAAAARALGLFASERATPHLIAASFDDDAEVRAAAEEALRQISQAAADGVTPQFAPEKSTADEPGETAAAVPPSLERESLLETLDSIADQAGAVGPPELPGRTSELAVAEETETPEHAATVQALSPEIAASDEIAGDEDLRREEQAVKEQIGAVNEQILGVVAAIKEAENEISWRTERENQLRAEAVARRLEEEALRKRADEEAQAQQAQEREALLAEQEARLKTHAEVQRHAAEEKELRLQLTTLQSQIADVARRRHEFELSQQEAAQAAKQAEAMRVRDESKNLHEAELVNLREEEETLKRAAEDLRQQQAQLRIDIEHLREANEQVAKQRAEVEAARQKADAENEEFGRAQLRMREAQQARVQAEQERSEIEAEINRQLEIHKRSLEETRQRQQHERERLEEEIRLQAAKEKAQYEEMQAMKARAEAESNRLAEVERHLESEIDSLRISDLDTRRRIEDAEAKRRASEEAYRLIAEKVQRTEAEAHARTKEEEQILAKLENERRQVAVEAQSRAEQEKRIRDEIEMFRRLEAEERPRIEAATLQLAEIEKRVLEQKARLQELYEARSVAEEQLRTGEFHEPQPIHQAEVFEPLHVTPEKEMPAQQFAGDAGSIEMVEDIPAGAKTVSPTISTYLTSIDPYKRAAAVAELARSKSPDAFNRIAECFDDHSTHVRNAAARALRKLEPSRTVDLFNRALEGASPERKRNIGAAIAGSGLAEEAVNNLAGENREDTYNALSMLFVMAKTGEVQPLVAALEAHRDDEIGRAVSKLLTLSGHQPDSTANQESAAKASGGSD